MNYIETIKENLAKVHELRNAAAGTIREFYILPYQEARAAINANPDLSNVGKERKLSELRERFKEEVMKAASDMQRAKDKALENVRKAAQQILVQPLDKVDEVTQKLFNEKMREVQAAVMFSTNSMTALDALSSLLDVEHASLAKEAAEAIQKLANEVIALANGEEKQHVKQQLGLIHSELYGKGLPQGAQEAKEALETIKAMRQSSLMPQVVLDALGSISNTLKEYVNKPQDYVKE